MSIDPVGAGLVPALRRGGHERRPYTPWQPSSRHRTQIMTRALLSSTLALALLAPSAGWAAPKPAAAPKIELYAYELQHQRADEAFVVIQPLLSPQGTIELRPRDNTLVIRDTRPALDRLTAALKAFDHPARQLEIEVTMVQATRASFSPLLADQALSPSLAARLKLMLPFSNYRVLASTVLHTREGEDVTYEIGEGFEVRFRSGVVRPMAGAAAFGGGEGAQGQSLKLTGFRLSRQSGGTSKSLLSTSMTLLLDKPLALTLAGSEASSTALVVVLQPRLDGNGSR